MASFSKNDVILVRYPFSGLSASKVRPAVVVNAPHVSQDLCIVLLTSRAVSLLPGGVPLIEWRAAELNVPTVEKRGLYNVHETLAIKTVALLLPLDADQLEGSLKGWLGLS